MESIKIFRIIKSSFHVFFIMMIIGILFTIQHYPHAYLIGMIGLFGAFFAKYIPYYLQFKAQQWKLNSLNVADTLLWFIILFGAFRFFHHRVEILHSSTVILIHKILGGVCLALYLVNAIKWFMKQL